MRWNREPRFAGRFNVQNDAIDSEEGSATHFTVKEYFAGSQGITPSGDDGVYTGYDWAARMGFN